MKITVLTGKRGGYDAMRPMLLKMRDDPFFDLSIIACDMHLDTKFGCTFKQIEKDFPRTHAVVGKDDRRRQRRLGYAYIDLASAWYEYPPDLLMLYGDRGESLVAASVAVGLNIPIAHLQGGDVSGTQDDIVRHMITKAANLHFVSTYDADQRICAMDESPERSFIVGDSHIDSLVEWQNAPRKTYSGYSPAPDIIVLQHPDQSDSIGCYEQMRRTMSVMAGYQNDYKIAVIYPCSDEGHEQTIEAINAYKSDKIDVYPNVPQDIFFDWMYKAKVLVGNSSAGIIEAPYFGLPVVNIGDRQKGRARGGNIFHCGYDIDDIELGIEIQLHNRIPPDQPFGDGNAWRKIIEVLKDPKASELLKPKRSV